VYVPIFITVPVEPPIAAMLALHIRLPEAPTEFRALAFSTQEVLDKLGRPRTVLPARQ
jgi:hypothetical protein